MRPLYEDGPPAMRRAMAIDGQHHMYLSNADGETYEMDLDDEEFQIVKVAFDQIAEVLVKRRGGRIAGGFILRPIPELMRFFAHGDQMNIHIFVEQFRLPLSMLMSFDGIAITMRKALDAMRIAPH